MKIYTKIVLTTITVFNSAVAVVLITALLLLSLNPASASIRNDPDKPDEKEGTSVANSVVAKLPPEREIAQNVVAADEFHYQPGKSLKYQKYHVELPLQAQDYYYGKFINASVAAREINRVPILKPGDRVELIEGGFITFNNENGYIKPAGDFKHASGVCWSTSTLGMLMDNANSKFQSKYKKPLFVFEAWDRYGHKKPYATYKGSNYGWGYAVAKEPAKTFDYKFTVNPELKNDEKFKDLKIKIILTASQKHSWGYAGQVIGGYLEVNKDI